MMRLVTSSAMSAIASLCVVFAGPLGSAAAQANERHPLEPSDTSSPRATLASFIDSCNEIQEALKASEKVKDPDKLESIMLPARERVLDCLNLSELPNNLRQSVGVESALFLKEVLDRIDLPAEDEIPDSAAVRAASDASHPFHWRIPATRITVARVEEGLRRGECLFTPDTVRRAREYYVAVKQLGYRQEGPKVSKGIYESYLAVLERGESELMDTSSPRGTLTLFLNSMNEMYTAVCVEKTLRRGDPEVITIGSRAGNCLDVSELSGYSSYGAGVEAMICLKEVLDRVPLPPAEDIPGLEDVKAGGAGEELARWQVPGTRIMIVRVQEGSRRGEYLFSPTTVSRAREFYEEVKDRPYRTDGRPVSEGLYDQWLSMPTNSIVAYLVGRLPDWAKDRIHEVALWQWVGLLLAILVGLGAMFAAYRIGRLRSERFREKNLLRYCVTLIFPIVAMLIPLAFKYVVWEYLMIRGDVLYAASFAANLVFLIAAIVLLLGVSSRIAEAIVALPRVRSQGLDAQFTRILCRGLGIVAAVIVFLEGGKYLGFPLTTLLAGAGISGLAIALAAQSLIKGLFGTVTILFDKPYQAGERILVKGYDGVVEEIGMRATKLRLLTGHLVSIPNDLMADSEIENIGRRPHIRRTAVIEMPSDTPTAKVKRALEIVRAALKDHEGMEESFPPRVYLRDLKESSIGIFMIYWYHPPKYWDFLAFSERVNLQIMEQLEAECIDFAAPALTVHTGDDQGREPDAAMSTENHERKGS